MKKIKVTYMDYNGPKFKIIEFMNDWWNIGTLLSNNNIDPYKVISIEIVAEQAF